MVVSILTAVLISVAATVIGIIGKAASDWLKQSKAEGVRHEAIEALSMGIGTIGETAVKSLKEKAKDGKLDWGDIKHVQKKAIDEAKKIATDPKVVEFLTKTLFDTLAAIITSIVQGGKKDVKD